jgi:hypothetical protein
MRRLGLLLLLLTATAEAKTLTERSLTCEPAVILQLVPGPNDGDSPMLSAETVCTSRDAKGDVLRTVRKNRASKLTANQIQVFTRFLQRIAGDVGASEGIPTPLATPTDLVVRTPAPEPT